MSPDLLFFVSLAIKMGVAAFFVIAATVAAERAGPLVGGLIATLPLSAGPSYVFLALDHTPDFIAASATMSAAVNVVTGLYGLVFILLAQRMPVYVSVPVGLLVYFIGVAAVMQVAWTPLTAGLANVLVVPIYYWLARPYRDVQIPRMRLRAFDFLLRAGLVTILVALVVTLSFRIGPRGSGILAVFPVIYTSIMIILKLRAGGPAAAAVLAGAYPGLAGFGACALTLALTAESLETPLALTLALVVAIAWNLAVYALHRGRATPA